jgi:hypothetical protein
MQRTADRQKTLAAHGVAISDKRLPIEVLYTEKVTAVEGRILVHGQDEYSGRNYLMLEGTDAKVHYIHYTPEMELLRADGGLRTNSFLRLRKVVANGKPVLSAQDFGDSEKVLRNRALMGETARSLMRRGCAHRGWLGRLAWAVSSRAGRHSTREFAQQRS